MKRILYVALLMFWATCPLLAQKKYDKALAKADAAYDYGDYEGAIKILENKFYNKVKKKLGVQNKYTPGYYLRTAQYKWALGVVVSFEQNIEKALNESKIVYGENTEAHILTMMNVADLYILYGNFIKARNLTEEVNDKYMSFEQKDKNIRARIDLLMAKVLWGQGYFQDAIRYVSERETYFMGRIVDKESFVDATGKLQSVKLSERELYQRNADYATILTYKAKILGDMGEIDEAWFAYEAARDWIVKSRALGKKSFEYITNQFSFANFKVANGLDIDLLGRGEHREEGYDYIHDILKKGFNESHFMAFDIYETLLLQYLKTGKMGRYRNMKSEYDRAIRKNFPRNSLHHINTSIVEFNAKLSKDKTNELEDRAKSVLANIQSLPKNHKKTIQVLEFLYRVSIKDLQFDHAKIYLEDIISIQKQLYGEDSPQFHLANIKLANFYVDYTNNLALAEEMYEKSFYQVVKKETTPLHPDYINTLNHLAALENQKDDFVKAQNILDEAMTVSLEKFRSEKDIEYAKELEHVARLQLNIGQYDLARENITKVLDIYKELKLKNDEYQVVHLIKALETFAVLLGIEGYFDEAEESIEEARDLLEDARTLEGYNQLSSLDKLAGLHVFLGNYSESKEILDQLIPEYEKLYGKQSGKLVESLINKGRVEMLLGDYATAETTSRHVNDLSVIIFGEKSTRTSATLQLMGELLINIGDYEKAKEHLLKSVEILEERFGRNHIDVALALSQYGLARFYNGDDFDEVEKIMTEARDIIGDKLSNMNPRYAEVSTNLAKVYIQSTKYTEAFAALSLSESIWLNITGRKGRRNNVKIGQINSLAGDLYYFQKNYIKAKEFYDKALDIYKRTLNKNHPEYVKVLTKLSKVYYMEGEGRQAKET
ncbi:MAG: tetratricopeptide repeat protein, partial [Cyclobacteriaceae bacterium]|nr:tetratricopeptide repeat protein [Cyclobacteriaceae bacterium]